MPPLLPGTPEHFFDQLATFLRQNARGDVRCLVLTQTSTKQFWVSSSYDDLVWEFGMLKIANETMKGQYLRNQEATAALIEAQQKAEQEEELKSEEVKGKVQ